jgi:hypothetical protein
MTWKGIVGQRFDPEAFDAYCHGLAWLGWRPSLVVLHNTYAPTLAQRPQGFTREHIRNLENYYKNELGWKAGPHLFIDDNGIWVFTFLTVSGVHSPIWNKTSLGVEMLGNYEVEPFNEGRGRKVQSLTVKALATLHAVLGLDPRSLKLHWEDPLTKHKCPGKNVNKQAIIDQVFTLMRVRHPGDHDPKRMPILGVEHLATTLPPIKPRPS